MTADSTVGVLVLSRDRYKEFLEDGTIVQEVHEHAKRMSVQYTVDGAQRLGVVLEATAAGEGKVRNGSEGNVVPAPLPPPPPDVGLVAVASSDSSSDSDDSL